MNDIYYPIYLKLLHLLKLLSLLVNSDICRSSRTCSSAFSNSLCNFIYETNISYLPQLISCPIQVNTLDLVHTKAIGF